MKTGKLVQARFDDGRVVCGNASNLTFESFDINGERILFIDLKEFRTIEQYVKKETGRVSSKIGVPSVRNSLVAV